MTCKAMRMNNLKVAIDPNYEKKVHVKKYCNTKRTSFKTSFQKIHLFSHFLRNIFEYRNETNSKLSLH